MGKFKNYTYFAVAALLSIAGNAKASDTMENPDSAQDVTVSNVRIERSESFLNCNFTINFADKNLGSNRELRLNPVIIGNNGTETALPALIVAGRVRYIQARRHEKLSDSLRLIRFEKGMTLPYAASLPYEDWMETARIELRSKLTGCCKETKNEYAMTVDSLDFSPLIFHPVAEYIVPQAEAVKTRELRGRAFIDFPVNRTEIRPDYRNNTVELGKIRASIDSVRNDSDITITALSIKGFASPEGPWNNNVRLAKGRTEALKTYVENLYRFEPGLITTSYEPEDWEGLRNFVETSGLKNREAIMQIIDGPLAPDARDARIRSAYPEQYAFLLAEVYPALRHSDYKIDYTIRSYSDPKEIIEIMYTKPQNLSLEEFFTAARTLDPGSQTYNDLFETAVRMYPNSEAANLNAAASAITRGDYASAQRYLEKAGNSPQAIYTRGNLKASQGDFETALQHFQRAAKLKVASAPDAIAQTRKLVERRQRQGRHTAGKQQ